MAERRPLIDCGGEVRQLTARDAAVAVPFRSLPQHERRILLLLREAAPKGRPRKV